jgi:hypothetical protein
MTPDDRIPLPENPYAAPQPGLASEVVPSDDPANAQLRAFVGPRADVYLAKWHPLLSGTTGTGGFNWPAFLWSGLWIPYRKMYRITAVFYGIMLATTIGEVIVFVYAMGREVPPFLDTVIGLAAALVCGFSANLWYLAHARRVIAQVRALGLQDSNCLAEISHRGGTSFLAALGLFVCFVATMSGAVMFLEFLGPLLEKTP